MAGVRKPIDWPGIEADYRKTDTSVRELAKWYRTDESGIRRKAKRCGWQRPGSTEDVKPNGREARTEKRVERAVTVIAAKPETEAEEKPPAICAADLRAEAYATLRDVMANSEFPAPRVTAARAVIAFAQEEELAKGKGAGKKAMRQAGADKAASEGRFAVPQAPRSTMQ